MTDLKLTVGGSARDDARAFVEAWHRAEAGEEFSERVLAVESWDALAAVMSNERPRLLRHVHAHPERSVLALAKALGRQYRRVHEDVSILSEAGLLDRSGGGVRGVAGRIQATIDLGSVSA